MDIRTALKEAMFRLHEARVPSHSLAAELLLMHATGRDRAWLFAHPEESLESAHARHFFELVARRAAGTPTQYLTGKQEFWDLEFEVTPDVLIPRPETEHVVEVALERMGHHRPPRPAASGAGLRIADVGTGSGCLAVALAVEFPGATVVATDVSAKALDVARRNAARHGVANRIEFHECNLLDPFLHSPARRSLGDGGPLARPPKPWRRRVTPLPAEASEKAGHSPLLFDLIVSNPPYVAREEEHALPREVREHEPHAALFGGEKGRELYAPLIRQAAALLRSGGTLVCEIGYNALGRVRPLLDDEAVWNCVGVTNDLAGIPRVLAAERV